MADIPGGLLIRVRPWETIDKIEESKRFEATHRYRVWKENIFEPLKRRILAKVETRSQERSTLRSPTPGETRSTRRKSLLLEEDDDRSSRLAPRKWSRDKYDATVEGLQSREISKSSVSPCFAPISGAPYQDHYNFPSRFAAYADAEFPRGRRICALPHFYRRDPILSTIS